MRRRESTDGSRERRQSPDEPDAGYDARSGYEAPAGDLEASDSERPAIPSPHGFRSEPLQPAHHPTRLPGRLPSPALCNRAHRGRHDRRPKSELRACRTRGTHATCTSSALAARVKEGVSAAGLVGMRFTTIGVSDGMSMGTEGMSYSLPSRDLIADSIETVVAAHWYDGVVTIPGCDKNMPGSIMAMARLDRPASDGLRRHDPARARRATAPCSTSSRRSSPTASGSQVASTTIGAATSSATRAPVLVRAVACTRRTRWRPRSRHWA